MLLLPIHLHPDVSAEILPIKFKPAVMPIIYNVFAFVNLDLYKKLKS